MKLTKVLAVAVALLVVAALALWASPFGRSLRGALGLIEPVYDTAPPEWPAGFGEPDSVSVLVFSKTNGFRHAEAIPAAEAAVREIAARHGWRVFATENGAVFDDERLAQVDVVFGNNCTGDNWTPGQKEAFRGLGRSRRGLRRRPRGGRHSPRLLGLVPEDPDRGGLSRPPDGPPVPAGIAARR